MSIRTILATIRHPLPYMLGMLLLASCSEHKTAEPMAMMSTSIAVTGGASSDAAESAPLSDGVSSAVAQPGNSNADSISTRNYTAGQLTAGEWSDLDHWDFWTRIIRNREKNESPAYWGINPERRISALVINGEHPVVDAHVRLLDAQRNVIWEARTDNRGKAELFAGIEKAAQGPFTVQSGSASATVTDQSGQGTTAHVQLQLPRATTPPFDLDVMFAIDATGSMGDELEYIKTELADVIDRVRTLDSRHPNIRLSCNFYRDQGDEYVVRSFPFTTSIDEAVDQIERQHADGGGDYEEAVEEALDDAINNHTWSSSATARLLFLVLDAPPHYSPDRIEKLRKLTADAARQGVRIVPIASSGIDKSTEFLLRLLAITTDGTYVFLTDDSGIGDSHIEPTIGPYKVEYLNDLMVRLIGDYTRHHEAVTEGDGGTATLR